MHLDALAAALGIYRQIVGRARGVRCEQRHRDAREGERLHDF